MGNYSHVPGWLSPRCGDRVSTSIRWASVVVKFRAFGTTNPGLITSSPLAVVWPWANYLTSLTPSSLPGKVG